MAYSPHHRTVPGMASQFPPCTGKSAQKDTGAGRNPSVCRVFRRVARLVTPIQESSNPEDSGFQDLGGAEYGGDQRWNSRSLSDCLPSQTHPFLPNFRAV